MVRVQIEVEVHGRRCRFRLPARPLEKLQPADIEPRHRFLRKLESVYENSMQALEHADRGLLLYLKKLIRYLESHISPDESLMKQLRKADLVEIRHPPQAQEKWVRRMFRRFINKQVRYHRQWLVINLLVLPLTGAMVVIPGPNVFFGWNAFRLISHYLACEGGKRVQSGQCEIQVKPQSVLGDPHVI
ncbi:MAG: hypothetical protein RMM98_03320 [Acidobacteriota bacterium]|nr:mitochondrial K+-H+ exchange-related family protein [Blastocatellia bacterium]MDW8238623.1 hypothetical protein [Acidobacteriota bacterium]